MKRIFRYLEPTCFSGLIDDPCLIIRDRPIHQSIMLDCGSLSHVAKREIKPVRAIFVSHAHMDHFMGFDMFLRQIHASPRTVELFGPPGFADRVEARLGGYNWNLAEPYWCKLIVHEVHQRNILSFQFSGPEAFARSSAGELYRENVIYRFNHIEVAAELLDHGIPVLAFRVNERKIFSIDKQKIDALGLTQGEWLCELKKRFFTDWRDSTPITALRKNEDPESGCMFQDARTLYDEICGEYASSSIGYLTDIGFEKSNQEKAEQFLCGVTLLIGECSFLRENQHKARASHHLCTSDVNLLLDRIQPKYFMPVHLSKTYLGYSYDLYNELTLPQTTELLRLPEHLPPRPICSSEAVQLFR